MVTEQMTKTNSGTDGKKINNFTGIRGRRTTNCQNILTDGLEI